MKNPARRLSTPLTPAQAKILRQHVIDCHAQIAVYRRKTADIMQDHARRHHHATPNHYHEGVNTGPHERPDGWYTGEGAVAR